MSEWQPIETAPKDGTRVLLWLAPPHATTTQGAICAKWGGAWGWQTVPGSYQTSMATHWMPLPDPPQMVRRNRA